MARVPTQQRHMGQTLTLVGTFTTKKAADAQAQSFARSKVLRIATGCWALYGKNSRPY